ncbi:MAG: spondin domain-containing protein [Planctomycetota bacterium]
MLKSICVGTGLMVLGVSQAAAVQVQVTVENLAPDNGVSFAPLRVGFHSGVFDAFDEGLEAFLLDEASVADAPIVSIAEGGSGSTWFPAFEAADPTATLGTVVSDPAGPLLPGAVAVNTFTVDPSVNPYFTFGAMVIPSNDLFVGNDSAIQLFDANGNLAITEILQTGAAVWDAGSEQAIAANAAFLVGGTNADRVDENGVVTFELDELAVYDGLETAAGYFYDNSLISNDSQILRISFAVIPEPATISGLALLAPLALRRRG